MKAKYYKTTKLRTLTNRSRNILQTYHFMPILSWNPPSVWYDTYRFLTDELKYKNVTLSNPYLTKAIAASKKKTDKIDARILADLLRGGYIAKCYVPNKKIVQQRQLVRYRKKLIQWRTAIKNSIHGILLQGGIKIPGVTFTEIYCRRLRGIRRL